MRGRKPLAKPGPILPALGCRLSVRSLSGSSTQREMGPPAARQLPASDQIRTLFFFMAWIVKPKQPPPKKPPRLRLLILLSFFHLSRLSAHSALPSFAVYTTSHQLDSLPEHGHGFLTFIHKPGPDHYQGETTTTTKPQNYRQSPRGRAFCYFPSLPTSRLFLCGFSTLLSRYSGATAKTSTPYTNERAPRHVMLA